MKGLEGEVFYVQLYVAQNDNQYNCAGSAFDDLFSLCSGDSSSTDTSPTGTHRHAAPTDLYTDPNFGPRDCCRCSYGYTRRAGCDCRTPGGGQRLGSNSTG